MTLISVTTTILKPISPDVARPPDSHKTHTQSPRPAKFRSRCLWPAQTSLSGSEAGHPGRGWPKSSAGFQLALMVPPASVPFLRRGQPATQRQVRWTQVDEQEHPASPETPAAMEAAASGETVPATRATPVTEQALPAGPAAGSGRDRRGDGVRDVITSRGAGWAVAAAMAGAVVGLSVAMATSSSPTIVVQDSAAGLLGTPAGAVRAAVPGGALRAAAPGRVQVQAPARLRIQTPARLRIQVPAGGPLRTPARLRIQIPAAGPLQAPAQLRLVPASGSAGTLIPLPSAPQVLPAMQAIGDVMAPRAVHLRIRPGQVRVRLRVPVNGRIQVLPRNAAAGPLRVVVPGSSPATLVPTAPARLRIAFRNGAPVPAQVLVPASLPGQARLRIQVPTRARIQVPARARITPAPPAPPNW